MHENQCNFCKRTFFKSKEHYERHLKRHKGELDFDLETIRPFKNHEIEELKNEVINIFFSKSGFKVCIKKLNFVKENIKLYESIFYYSSKSTLKEKISHILENFSEIKCKNCSKLHSKVRLSGKKIKGSYYCEFCSIGCTNAYSNKFIKDREIFKQTGKKIAASRKANNSYIASEKTKKKMSERAKMPETIAKKRKANLEKYGFENPGILGGHSSKICFEYIKKFISEKGISEENCYFQNGGVNGEEYFLSKKKEIINGVELKEFYKYDLVVVDENKKPILVLEYNGQFHYSLADVLKDPNGNSIPYKSCKKTKKEFYEKEIRKLNEIKKYTDNIFIYWEKHKLFEKYDNDSLLLRQS